MSGPAATPGSAEALADTPGPAEALAADLRLAAVTEHGLVRLDVPVSRWVEAARAARDRHGFDLLDWLGAVDQGADGVEVVLQLWSVPARAHVALRTRLAVGQALPTLAGVWAGAVWSEREIAEMYGVALDGHPDPRPLLLPDAFEGHPLRKDFVLATRVAKAWPGAKEPGEGAGSRPPRRRARPPGVPAEGTWPAPELP